MPIDSPNPESWSPDLINKRAMEGTIALVVRQVAVQGVNVIGSILLARMLSPSDFGLYAIITFLLSFLVTFGGTGLASNLIRQSGEPSHEDYCSVFTVQQLLIAFIVIICWLASPYIAGIYHLPQHYIWLFRIVIISLIFTSFMVIPQVRLERNLAFNKLALVETGQALIYNIVAVFLAARGFGAFSFVWAMLVRSFSGAILANWVSPWQIGLRWDWQRAWGHLHFGLLFMGSSLISLLKDSITPVLVGILLGPIQVGYINWAGMVAAYPVLMLMIFQRIYMPVFARIQLFTEQMVVFVEKVILAANTLAAPFAMLSLIFIEPITRYIFGEKWLEALPLFFLLWVANLFVPTATPLLGLLNALGHSQITFNFTLLWMLATWLIGTPLIIRYGAIGFAIANLLVQFTNFYLYKVAKRQVPFRIISIIKTVWVLAAGIDLFLYLSQHIFPINSLVSLLIYIFVGTTLYGFGIIIIYYHQILHIWTFLRSQS